jgi:hypothetical protein
MTFRVVPFMSSATPPGRVVPLPRSAGPGAFAPGKAGVIQWLQRERPDILAAIKAKAPQLLTQASLHGYWGTQPLGVTTPAGFDPSMPVFDFNVATPDVWTPSVPTIQDPSAATAPASSSWASAIASIAAPLLQSVSQIKVLNTQLDLARQGRPPLNVSQLGLPPLGVSVGASSQTLMVVGAIGLAIAAALFLGRRRSA